MNIYFEEDDLWVFVTQHVESWSYSDTGLAAGERGEHVIDLYWALQAAVSNVHKNEVKNERNYTV